MSLHLLLATMVTFAAFGYFVAGLSTALGVGASLFCVPVLLLLLQPLGVGSDAAPAVAIATSLAASCLMSAASAWAHWRSGNLASSTLRGSPRTILAAAVGSGAGGALMADTTSAGALAAVAVAQLLVAATLLIRLRRGGSPVSQQQAWTEVLGDTRTAQFTAAVGALTSIGAGGVFFVPYFTARGVPRVQAAAWASLLGVAIAPCATAVYALRSEAAGAAGLIGLVHWPIAAAIALGALFGAKRGAAMGGRFSARNWTWLLFAILLASSARAASKLF